jgi:RNA polymerase sigma factor (sigma-70 family)
VFRIAHNTALDALRRRDVAERAVAALDEPPLATPADPVEQAALGRALEAALGGLRPDMRTALVLRYQEGQPYEDIADVLNIPIGTAKTFVHRARRQLAETLAAAGWRPKSEDPVR